MNQKVFLILFILAQTGFAHTVHARANTQEDSNEFALFKNPLPLPQLKLQVLKRNTSIQMAYEKVIQARNRVRVALANFLPRINLLTALTAPLGIWPSIKATMFTKQILFDSPSNWFNYKSSKAMAMAEKYALTTIKRNILQEVGILYYNLLADRILYHSMVDERGVLAEELRLMVIEVELGITEKHHLNDAKIRATNMDKQIRSAQSLLESEFSSLRIALNLPPTVDLKLPYVTAEVTSNAFAKPTQHYIEKALHYATELKQLDKLVQAASAKKSASKWSIIGFSGIGLDYFANIRIAKSEIRALRIQRQQARNEIANQVDLAIDDVFASIILNEKDQELAEIAENDYTYAETVYQVGHTTQIPVLVAKRALIAAQREKAIARLNQFLKVIQLERLTGLQLSPVNHALPKHSTQPSYVVKKIGSRYHYKVFIPDGRFLDPQVTSVRYRIVNSKKRSRLLRSGKKDYLWSFRSRLTDFTLTATIRMIDESEEVQTLVIQSR